MKPIPVGALMLTWKPTEWIVDLFGAKGACVLLAGDKGSGKSVLCIEWRKLSRMANNL